MYLLKRVFITLSIAIPILSCSDFDEQDFTVLLPNAGEDFIFLTGEEGTSINLDGTESSDVNGLGFEYKWEIVDFPEGTPPALEGATTSTPTLQVDEGISGRIVVSLIIFRDDQQARDFINVDVNPSTANVLLVNAIEGSEEARLVMAEIRIEGNPVSPLNADDTYYSINLEAAADAEGNVVFNVEYNDSTLSITRPVTALASYTLYLAGGQDTPELILIEKRYNETTIPLSWVGLDAVNMAPGISDMVLWIDATTVGFSVSPIDPLFRGLGVREEFGVLSFGQSGEILFPKGNLSTVPIWATQNGERISTDSGITLNRIDEGQFGTFILFEDSSSEFGYTLKFVNNTELLPAN